MKNTVKRFSSKSPRAGRTVKRTVISASGYRPKRQERKARQVRTLKKHR